MTESLIETYARLKRNIEEAQAKVDVDPSIKNKEWHRLMVKIYYDFCATFTENILSAISQTTDAVQFM